MENKQLLRLNGKKYLQEACGVKYLSVRQLSRGSQIATTVREGRTYVFGTPGCKSFPEDKKNLKKQLIVIALICFP